jgi:hypothetical protein
MINHASILALMNFLRKHRNSDARNINTINNKLKKQDLKNFRITFEYFKLAREKVRTNSKYQNTVR